MKKDRTVNVRTLHRSNCQQKVRASFKDAFGKSITLLGKHGFEYEIVEQGTCFLSVTTFPNREQALKELKKKGKLIKISQNHESVI